MDTIIVLKKPFCLSFSLNLSSHQLKANFHILDELVKLVFLENNKLAVI